MKYFMNIGLVISFALVAHFLIKDNDGMLLATIGTIIGGFWYGVLRIAHDEEALCLVKQNG
jgi:hypothetical protein